MPPTTRHARRDVDLADQVAGDGPLCGLALHVGSHTLEGVPTDRRLHAVER